MSATAQTATDEATLRKRLKDLKRLKPYDAVEAPAAAPVGSELARLVGEAAAAAVRAAEMDQRVAALRGRLAATEQVIDAAGEDADFAVIAARLAEREVLTRVLRRAEDELRGVHAAVTEAEQQVALVWSQVTTARSRLRRAINDPADVFNDLGRDYRPRTDAIWVTLEKLLGAGASKRAA